MKIKKKMNEWVHIEGDAFKRIVVFFIFLIDSFISASFYYLALHSVDSKNIFYDILLLVVFSFVMNLFFIYIFMNSPNALFLTDKYLVVRWNRKRTRAYPWHYVKLSKQRPLFIRVVDKKWAIFHKFIPRIIFLMGFSDYHEELMHRVHIKLMGA
jgi:hypothetical protein